MNESGTGNREESLFNEAMQLATSEARAAFLKQACAGDEQLRQRVEALLAAAQPTNDFLEVPAPGARTFLSASPGAAGSPSPPPEERGGERRPPQPTISLTVPISEKPGDKIGHYKLLEQIGEGGCGVVYMAEQTEPIRRRVAFKVIKLGMDTKSVVARFEAERQALALMDHPNIAKVLDAGATETGRPYFVMELVKGIKITDYCDQNHLSTKERLELFMQVCHAVQHAHQKGIIHRDLKPSNILVTLHDGVPVPKVIDFGIAKATQQPLTDKTLFTAYQQFIGTPAYMSPEQAELSGLDIDTRSDIYSLGVLLYELLTGKPPFEPETLLKAGLDEMRRIIRETEPPKPSTKLATTGAATPHTTLRTPQLKEVRGDLDWIVMKCLEKDRRRRYETANGLAQDVERHLNHEPVEAAAPGVFYRFKKLVRRNAMISSSICAVGFALIVGLGLSTWLFLREQRTRQLLEERAYASDMVLASRTANSGAGLGNAARLLSLWQDRREDLRGWEWYYLSGLCHQEILTLGGKSNRLTSAAWSPDGRRLAAGGASGDMQLWDAVAGTSLLNLPGHGGSVSSVNWHPDGRRLVSGATDGSLTVWDLQSTSERLSLPGHTNEILCTAWSPDGKKLASGSADRTIRLWELAGGSQTLIIRTKAAARSVSWSSDGTKLAAGITDGTIKLFDTTTGLEVFDFGPKTGTGWKAVVAWSPDGKWLATGGDDFGIRIWDAETGVAPRVIGGHGAGILSLAWSFDSGRLASACAGSGTVKIWELPGGRLVRTFRAHLGGVRCLAWTKDGTLLASVGVDGTLKVWDAVSADPSVAVFRQPDQVVSLAWHPDGRRLATGSRYSSAWIWETTPPKSLVELKGDTNWLWAVAWNPAGTRLATGGAGGWIRLWDTESATEMWRVQDPAREIRSLAWSPDGAFFATVGGNNKLRIWEARYGTLVANQALEARCLAVAWSADGRRLAVGGTGICIVEFKNGKIGRTIYWQTEVLRSVAWSPDSTKLASAGEDGTVRIWDATRRTEIHALLGHGAPAYSVAWSPDGLRLATASWDRTVRIWHAASGAEVCLLGGFPAGVSKVVWSPDGRRIASCDLEGDIFIHDSTPGRASQGSIESNRAREGGRGLTAQGVQPAKWYSLAENRNIATVDAVALNQLAWTLATSPLHELRDGNGAIPIATRAVELTHRKDPNYLDTLAAACAEAGVFEDAIRFQREAIALLQDEEKRRDFTRRLTLYQANTPYHEQTD